MQYWDSIETASREELIDLQNTRLQEVVRAAAEQSPFYRERFKSIGVNIDSFKGLDDLRKLPFIEPADLLRNPSSIPPKDKRSSPSGVVGEPQTLPR